MRRLLVVAGLALFLLALAAPAPAQQRDPFDPLVTPQTGGTTTTGEATGSVGGTVSGGTGGVSEGLANTGASITPWLVTAYGLVAVGAGMVVWSRIRSPRTR